MFNTIRNKVENKIGPEVTLFIKQIHSRFCFKSLMTNTNIMCYGLSSNLDLFRICMDLNIFGLIMSRDNGKPEDKTRLGMEAFYYAQLYFVGLVGL